MKTKLLLSILALFTSMSVIAGTFVEFKITTEPGADPGSMKMYYQEGNTRTEMVWKSPAMPGGEMRITNIVLSSDLHKTYNLNEKDKTYTVSDWSAKSTEAKDEEYDVTVIGSEKVNGFNCTHVKVKRKNSQSEQDMWLSKDVTNYEMYKSMESKYTSIGMFKSFKEKGVDGFPARIKTSERGHDFQMDLVKAENRNIEASLFSLDGYKKSESPAGINGSMMQQYQNMTPEERQKMIDKMKEQYGKPGGH